MNCREIEEQLVFLFDDEMGREILLAFRTHVSHCPHCAQRASYTRRLLTIVRERAPRKRAPLALRTRILAHLAQRGRET